MCRIPIKASFVSARSCSVASCVVVFEFCVLCCSSMMYLCPVCACFDISYDRVISVCLWILECYFLVCPLAFDATLMKSLLFVSAVCPRLCRWVERVAETVVLGQFTTQALRTEQVRESTGFRGVPNTNTVCALSTHIHIVFCQFPSLAATKFWRSWLGESIATKKFIFENTYQRHDCVYVFYPRNTYSFVNGLPQIFLYFHYKLLWRFCVMDVS